MPTDVDLRVEAESLRKIWWIASYPKSGNTLVRMFLNAYVTRFPLNINAHYQYATIDQQPQLLQSVAARPLGECHPVELALLRPAALMHYVQLVAPRDACLKTHHANVEVDGVPLIPTMLTKQAVYLVRDPRDVVISYASHSNVTIDAAIDLLGDNTHIGTREHNLADVILSWSSHVDSWHRAKFPVEVIRFEDLITDREATFRRILPALGFRKIDEESLEFALEQTAFARLRSQEQQAGFRETQNGEFFRVGRAGQWRDQLTAEQVARIEENHGKTMQRCSYEPAMVGVS